MEKEDKILLAEIEDLEKRRSSRNIITHTPFLDMRQAALVNAFCIRSRFIDYIFYGGYEDAERRLLAFLPGYITPQEFMSEYNPLKILRVSSAKGSKVLSHRDYLGSLLALGIKRETTGDILVSDNSADIIILKEMADFLLSGYTKAGRTPITPELKGITELNTVNCKTEIFRDTVASLRLDSVISSAFRLSRSRAREAVELGLVYVNSMQVIKPDFLIEEGDRLVLRGSGKAVLFRIDGKSRKDRICIQIQRYV